MNSDQPGEHAGQVKTGLERFTAFSDAVVAIAITLLILPLVDQAANLGNESTAHFLSHNGFRFFAFGLSFVVIANYWYVQHQFFESIEDYNSPLIWSGFLWLFCMVFLPFPTELLGSANREHRAAYIIYVATLLLANVATLLQQIAVVHWPNLQRQATRGKASITFALVFTVTMVIDLVITIFVPTIGLWSLLLLLIARPIDRRLRKLPIFGKNTEF